MLFITTRQPTENKEADPNPKPFQFDLTNNASSRGFFCCKRKGKSDYEEIGSEPLLDQIKKSGYRQVLLYLHGFSNLPEDVFSTASELQKLANQQKKSEVLVLPLIWPCDNGMGVVKDYWDDQKSADLSAFAFGRMLQRFMVWRSDDTKNPEDHPCLKRINVLAHSMGNRVFRETLNNWKTYTQADGLPLLFRNSFLVAADIQNESLHKGKPGELISYSSRNVIVYFASDDLALRASKVANLKNAEATRRLGHSGPEDMDLTPKNVYAIDCDDVNTQYDNPKGHSYFLTDDKGKPGIVFSHIMNTILTGRPFPTDEFRKTTILKA